MSQSVAVSESNSLEWYTDFVISMLDCLGFKKPADQDSNYFEAKQGDVDVIFMSDTGYLSVTIERASHRLAKTHYTLHSDTNCLSFAMRGDTSWGPQTVYSLGDNEWKASLHASLLLKEDLLLVEKVWELQFKTVIAEKQKLAALEAKVISMKKEQAALPKFVFELRPAPGPIRKTKANHVEPKVYPSAMKAKGRPVKPRKGNAS